MYPTVFISDLHLGTKKSKAKTCLKFLDEVEFEQIVLVGDIECEISHLSGCFRSDYLQRSAPLTQNQLINLMCGMDRA